MNVDAFYVDLVDQQEPLGVEFEKLLYGNLWNLYDGDVVLKVVRDPPLNREALSSGEDLMGSAE